jgi:excinuclease ABC subunit C
VTFSSKLNEISGIGPKRKKALLSVFGSINGIRTARISDLIKIPGITKNLAFLIKENLANNT